jgi:hypothetical protein
VGGGFSRPTLHPAHHISANFQRTKQLFVQQESALFTVQFRMYTEDSLCLFSSVCML